MNFEDFNEIFSGRNTSILMAVVPGGLYGVGLARKSAYSQKTALFSGEAVLDVTVLQVVMKIVTHRSRPSDIAPTGDFSDTFFQRRRLAASSFPSGHTLDAFAIATVLSRRYPTHHWVPWLAYGAAGIIGFSRITLQSHFPSDVFVGAALGYSVSRYVVLGGQ
jgi:membrane-associated phospholipid phosphatase